MRGCGLFIVFLLLKANDLDEGGTQVDGRQNFTLFPAVVKICNGEIRILPLIFRHLKINQTCYANSHAQAPLDICLILAK